MSILAYIILAPIEPHVVSSLLLVSVRLCPKIFSESARAQVLDPHVGVAGNLQAIKLAATYHYCYIGMHLTNAHNGIGLERKPPLFPEVYCCQGHESLPGIWEHSMQPANP